MCAGSATIRPNTGVKMSPAEPGLFYVRMAATSSLRVAR